MLVPGGASVAELEGAPQRIIPHGAVHTQHIRSGPSPQVMEHAKIVLDYFNALRVDGQTDVDVLSEGRKVENGHRLVLSAFSQQLKNALLRPQDWPTYTLDVDPHSTGISWMILREVVRFCYTGQCRYSDDLLRAAEDLGCVTLVTLLEKAKKEGFLGPIVDEYHAANLLDALYVMKMDGAFIDCLFVQKDARSECVRLHRLVLCAYVRHLENTLREEAKRSLQVSIVIPEPRATILDLRYVVDFFYMGYVRAPRKRLRSTRAAAAYLGVERLMGEIDMMIANGGQDEGSVQHGQQLQQAQFEDELDLDYGVQPNSVASSSIMHAEQQDEEDVMDDEYNMDPDDDADEMERMMESPYGDYDYEQADSPQQQQQHQHQQLQQQRHQPPPRHMQHDPTDVVGSSIEEHSRLYDYFVEGPKRGKRGGTYPLRTHQVKVKGPTVMVQDDGGSSDELQAVNVALAPAKRRRRDVDEYGYGLPQIHTASEVTVPLVVGDQQRMMDRPHKCPYCDHRAREKSAVDKHIRCKHTHETPFKCRFCSQAFSVQSNLVRHIRAHTGEKPYKCTKCGQAYADKKNMDAHVYRDHLKQQQLTCGYPNCTAKFWRQDRIYPHYLRVHGCLPHLEDGAASRVGWVDQ